MKTKVVVGVIIENKKGEILMGKKENGRIYPGKWLLPGGGIDEGESVDKAALREVKEETGLDVIIIKRLNFDEDMVEKIDRDGTKNKYHMVFLSYLAKLKSGKLLENDDLKNIRWFEKSELKEIFDDLCPPSKRLFSFLGWID